MVCCKIKFKIMNLCYHQKEKYCLKYCQLFNPKCLHFQSYYLALPPHHLHPHHNLLHLYFNFNFNLAAFLDFIQYYHVIIIIHYFIQKIGY